MKHASLSIYVALYVLVTANVCDGDRLHLSSLPNFEIFQTQSLRADFVNASDHRNETILLQEYGSVDAIKSFFLEVPPELNVSDISLQQVSSNENVLSVSSSDNLFISTSSTGLMNITAMFSFDLMVGKTEYTLLALKKGTDEVIGTITVPFIIAGMTFFSEPSPGNVTVLSGDSNSYNVHYKESSQPFLDVSERIRVLIQYPNGSSSDDMKGQVLPFISTLQHSVSGYRGQFLHEATECDSSTIGTLSDAGELRLPPGCGYGFYEDSSGNLLFGVEVLPYRVGNITFQCSWAELASMQPELSGEIFEFSQHISITGNPPVVVQAIYPADKLWRPEGGEIVTFEMINADLYDISEFELTVEGVTRQYETLYDSFTQHEAPTYSQNLSFVTSNGEGVGLGWTLLCKLGSLRSLSSSEQEVLTALSAHGFHFLFSYDTQALTIDTLTPSFGRDEGGTRVVISGYFPSFDIAIDGLYFSGFKLNRKYIQSVSNESMVISSPAKSELGNSYEFLVHVQMGNAVSNSKLFSFVLKDAEVRISQSGTSEINEETFSVGDCTPTSFTAVVTPFTNQIESYKWVFHLNSNPDFDLLETAAFESSNASAQTLELDPDSFDADSYTLKVTVRLQGKELSQEILLLREHKVSIGAFIMPPLERTIASPDTPLRLSAIVRPPEDCYEGNQTMIFEWTAFNETKTFSTTNATGIPATGNFSTTPARLGWEYVVPRESLTHGNHTVEFRVWMAEREGVSGQASTQVVIAESPLVAVIRHGEEQLAANYLSTLSLFGSKSYDPDIVSGDSSAGITYEWSCRQSQSTDFSTNESTACLPALVPSTTGVSFSAPLSVLEALGEVQYLQYSLIVRKGGRKSLPASLTIEIQNRGTKPFLDDYEIILTAGDGTTRDWNDVAHYERSIITVKATSEVSWTYALLEPSIPDFFSSPNLINTPLFFSADSSLFTVSGNTKPLGIEAARLTPFTKYRFKILFDGGTDHEATSVIVSLQTTEAPIVGFPVPSITQGTTNTTFTATAGIPRRKTVFSYYFVLADNEGSRFCVGGCTGNDVAYFRIGRPGTYSLSAYIFDMQGKALLDSKTLTENITVLAPSEQTPYLPTLQNLFDNGDDNSWTQLAHDLALILLEVEPASASVRTLAGLSGRQEATAEDLLDARMEYALNISDGSRKIFCNSYPNSFHGSDCMSLASDLALQSQLDTQTVYNLMVTVECCVQNTPVRTINKMGPNFPSFLDNLNRIARTIDQGGGSRRRLLSTTGAPANLLADVQAWTSREISASVTSGQLDGFTGNYSVGSQNEYGQVSVVVASNPGHLPVKLVNGLQRRVVMGPSTNELFYPRDSCLSKIFTASADKKRFFVLYTVDNFLLEGFQDPPTGTNLADSVYWVYIFERDVDGRFIQLEIPKEDACFCWRLPVLRKREFLEETVEYMAGMFSVTNFKDFGVDVLAKGEAFSYVYDGIVTSEYNATEGWVEACRDQVGLVSSTLVPRSASNAIGNGGGTVLGTGAAVIVGLVVGVLLFVVVAMASAWIFAARAMSDVAAPLAALAPADMYVERDVYGRGTIFDVNAVSLPDD